MSTTKNELAALLREMVVFGRDLTIGDEVLVLDEYCTIGTVIRFDGDGDPILRSSSGNERYLHRDRAGIRLFAVGELVTVYLPVNSEGAILGGQETLRDVTGYLRVYADSEENKQRLMETVTDRTQLLLDLVVDTELPKAINLSPMNIKMLSLVADNYPSAEQARIFFNEFMEEMS